MANEKMSVEKKTKMIYSGELMIFAILFAVIGTLEIVGVIGNREIMLKIYNYVTLAGGTWLIVDFVWTLCSEKKRAKNSLLDKIILLPLGIYLITFDILCLCEYPLFGMEFAQFRRLMMSIAFYYLAAAYLFQSIYHYFYPIPAIIQAIEEEKKEKEAVPEAPAPEEAPAEEIKEDEEKPQK